jgi:hypothetical protein
MVVILFLRRICIVAIGATFSNFMHLPDRDDLIFIFAVIGYAMCDFIMRLFKCDDK